MLIIHYVDWCKYIYVHFGSDLKGILVDFVFVDVWHQLNYIGMDRCDGIGTNFPIMNHTQPRNWYMPRNRCR